MNKKTRILIGGSIAIALIIGLFILKSLLLDVTVDLLWFSSVDLVPYYLIRHLYSFLVYGGVFLVMSGFLFINLWAAGRQKNGQDPVLPGRYNLLFLLVSMVLATIVSLPLFSQWEGAMLSFVSPSAGVVDPFFGKDISFYMFTLPLLESLRVNLLAVFAALFILVALIHTQKIRKAGQPEFNFGKGAKIHLVLLLVLSAFIFSLTFFIERYRLLYTDSHQPLFYGPGYVEMNVILPTIWLSIILLWVTVAAATGYFLTRKGPIPAIAAAVLFCLNAYVISPQSLTGLVERYIVNPNQLLKENTYIAGNIQSTLAAYGLDDIETREYSVLNNMPLNANDPAFSKGLKNIPVWNPEILSNVYQELQGIRTYYNFENVDVDRYTVDNNYRQVYLSPREINLDKLPDYTRNWTNIHLQYTHGHGLVMIPAAQAGDELMTWFLKDIPVTSEFGMAIDQPGIYFGLEENPYIIVPNDVGEIGVSDSKTEEIVQYEGDGGIPMASFFRKAIFALYFKDRNIFFTTKTNDKSRLLFRRNIIDRIKTITPFLKLDQDPYLVTNSGELYWIQDAYTTNAFYPASPLVNGEYNYIRNSIKIVVNAYTGKTDYYLFDEKDPVARAYQRMYPGLLKSSEEMPDGLRSHVRYPADIFKVQTDIYARYHQTDPALFYRQEDTWEVAAGVRNNDIAAPQNPYYLTLDFKGPGQEHFYLVRPMSPLGRKNLRALILAGNDGDDYGKIFVCSFPRDKQVFGPSQIQALINQDTEISEQFTLWGQAGSELIQGRIIIEPLGDRVLYIQPIYIQGEGPLKIPHLKRLIMAQGESVAMARSLEEAAAILSDKISGKLDMMRKRFPVMPEKATHKSPTTPSAESASHGEH